MTFTEMHLTAESKVRAGEINKAIDEYVFANPEKFGRTPCQGSGRRGERLRRYLHDEVLDALYAEYDALPREAVEVDYGGDASFVEY